MPVLMTQPALFGPGIDPETGVDLSRVAVGDHRGGLQWQILELYNDVTRQVARDKRVTLIDLAHDMPHDSRFYYDYYHFTNAGAAQVAQIVSEPLQQALRMQFPELSQP